MIGARSSYENVSPTFRYEADKIAPLVSLMHKPDSRLSIYGSYIEALDESCRAPTGALKLVTKVEF